MTAVTDYRTTPPGQPSAEPDARVRRRRTPVVAAALLIICCAAAVMASVLGDLTADGALVLVVFAAAVWCWVFSPLDDTYVALAAAVALVLVGVVDADSFMQTLGAEVIWLLLGSLVIAAAVTASGLATRAAARILSVARSPRQLVHLVTIALLATTFAVPATSGRAALALPIFLAVAAVLRTRPRLVLTLALVFPVVILFSAVGSLLGAGAHLITAEIIMGTTGAEIDFLRWLVLGLPLAIIWSHVGAEVALWMCTDRDERRSPVRIPRESVTADTGAFAPEQRRVLMILVAVVALWCTEPLHGINLAMIALLGAVAVTAPMVGAISLPAAVKTIPWNLLLFMAATLVLGLALVRSGAAEWLAGTALEPLERLDGYAAPAFVVVVAVGSLAAHLIMQSRSARSAVLVPIVIATAPVLGVDPVAAAFVSTAAAGYCITLTSSAKPVAMFAASDSVPGYRAADLLRFSMVLAPVSLALLLIFAFWVWPALGLTILP